jgi:ABC-type nitrate/sulfonate/bicarbonate transport system permease component
MPPSAAPTSPPPVAQPGHVAAGDARRPVPFRGGGFSPRRLKFVAPATFVAVALLWWLATALHWVSPIALPPPFDVLHALIDLALSGELFRHLGASLQRLLIGWTLGAVAGIALGFMIGLFSLARSSALPLVSALFPVPKIALLPLFIIWLGIGEASKFATIAFGVFSPMVIATFAGVDGVDRNLIRMAQSFGVPTFAIIRKIVLPGAMPAILSGVRISASIGIILLTAAEMIGAQHGVGALVLAAGNLMQVDQLLAGVVILSGLGLGVAFIVGMIERRLLRWR